MTPQEIQAYVNALPRTGNGERERTIYDVPGFGPVYRNDSGSTMWRERDPNRAGFNQIIDSAGNVGGYKRSNGMFDILKDPDFLKFLAVAGGGALAGMSGLGTAASGSAGGTGAGLGGLGGYAGPSGDFGLLSAGSSALPEVAAAGGGLSGIAGTGSALGGGTGISATGGASTAGGLASAAKTAGGFLADNASWLAPAAGGILGAASSLGQPDSQTSTTRQEIDPRMAQILYGANGNDGFLNQILAQSGRPQSAGISSFGGDVDKYLGSNGASQLQGNMNSANQLQTSAIGAPQMEAAQVEAPGQNNLNLSPAFNDMIYGDPAENRYLTGAIQKGINQSTNSFQDMLQDATKNLTQNVLPSIRGGAQVSGQYGGNRQGLAEGKALDSFNTGITRAASQFGQNNTDAAVGAQAGAFDAGRSRALSAMGNLSGNQYNTAITNAGFQQQANQNNQQSTLNTNALNSNNKIAGINASRGILGDAYQFGTNNDAYGLNRLGNVSSMLSPYTGLNSSQTSSQPLYQNTGGNILGGALAGLGFYNQFNKA